MNTSKLAERSKHYVRAVQAVMLGESCGGAEGECFTEEDMQELSSGKAQAAAGILTSMRPFRQLRTEFLNLDVGGKIEVLRAIRECYKPTWETLGRVSSEGQTQAGQDAEKTLAAAVAEYLENGTDVSSAVFAQQTAPPPTQETLTPAQTVASKKCSTVTAPDTNWNLIWQDDFDGPTLDYSKWECEVNAFGGGNEELQIYTDFPKNVRIENGRLVIEAHRQQGAISGTVREITSGRVRSKHRGDWKFGRFEICAKIPFGRGIWPAIWMLPTDDVYGPWAASGEIDIMEAFGREPGQILGTLHYGATWPNNASNGPVRYTLPLSKHFSDDFHVFTLEWTADKIRWFVDDNCFRESPMSEWHSSSGPSPAPFDQRFHLIFNVAVGGKPVDPPDNTTPFPVRLEIDWVKVYTQHEIKL